MKHDLDTDAQRQAAAWVRALPEEEPSLVWRAALNERVRAESARRARKRRTWLFATPGLGLATAAALAFVVLMPRAPGGRAPAPKEHVEASLVALYEDSVRTDDIVGSGLRPWEAPDKPAVEPDLDPALDLEAL